MPPTLWVTWATAATAAVALLAGPQGCLGVERVLLMRHCVRSPFARLRGRGDPAFDFPDNYSAAPFPPPSEWRSAGEAQCTARGGDLAEVLGASLRLHLPPPVSVVADNVSRCLETAGRVVRGLGTGARLDGTTNSLDPVRRGVCRPLRPDEMAAGVQEMLSRIEDPGDPYHDTWARRQELLEELQALVGHGVAPDIASIADKVSAHGSYVGGLHVAAEGFMENFLLEAGAGLSVAWGRLDGVNRTSLYSKWMLLDVLYNRINHGGLPLSTRNGAVIWDILRQLGEGTPGTRVVVGHDTNVDAVGALLGLSWTCGPFPKLSVPPMAGLLFEASAGQVAIRAVCARFEGEDAGRAVFGNVTRLGRDLLQHPATLLELQADVRGKLNLSCSAPAVVVI